MRLVAWLATALVCVLGCGDDESSPASSDTSNAGGNGVGAAGASGGAGATGVSAGGSGATGNTGPVGTCADPVPEGATGAPPAPTYSGGTCPALMPYPATNTLVSSGTDRSFLLAVPSNLEPGEKLPVIFLWHWLGGEAQDFYEIGDVQAAVDGQRFLAVIPISREGLQFRWPISTIDSDESVEQELLFFDDMLACVAEEFDVNVDCVSSAGVSAGALWTGVLAGRRGDRLASMISLSGGIDSFIKPWVDPDHKLPALVLWGGSEDICVVINFETASKALEEKLSAGNHFIVECIHNCGHTAPPVEAPPGLSAFGGIWKFAFDHPYWLKPGVSSYSASFPTELPTWCAAGAGSATPREGECPPNDACQ